MKRGQLKNRLGKEGQLKIQQMAFMLIAVFVFFILVFLFYGAVRVSNLESDRQEIEAERAVGMGFKIASSPEFVFEGKTNAIDADKIMLIKGDNEFRDFWDVDEIVIHKLYPEGEEVECRLSNYPECNKIVVLGGRGEGQTVSPTYVSLCRKEKAIEGAYDKCELGLISIKTK